MGETTPVVKAAPMTPAMAATINRERNMLTPDG
jgi:hypothetical protein